jgi:hypothetical protein
MNLARWVGLRRPIAVVASAVGLVSTLTSDPLLRAAIDQTPKCHTASG